MSSNTELYMESKMLENIINLKHFNDLRNSGLALLKDFLSSFFNCSVKMQQVKIEKFEAHFNLDIHTNINRNCYRIDENKIAIVIKVFEEKQGGVIAVMPIVLEGENVCNISNVIFERLAIINNIIMQTKETSTILAINGCFLFFIFNSVMLPPILF